MTDRLIDSWEVHKMRSVKRGGRNGWTMSSISVDLQESLDDIREVTKTKSKAALLSLLSSEKKKVILKSIREVFLNLGYLTVPLSEREKGYLRRLEKDVEVLALGNLRRVEAIVRKQPLLVIRGLSFAIRHLDRRDE